MRPYSKLNCACIVCIRTTSHFHWRLKGDRQWGSKTGPTYKQTWGLAGTKLKTATLEAPLFLNLDWELWQSSRGAAFISQSHGPCLRPTRCLPSANSNDCFFDPGCTKVDKDVKLVSLKLKTSLFIYPHVHFWLIDYGLQMLFGQYLLHACMLL